MATNQTVAQVMEKMEDGGRKIVNLLPAKTGIYNSTTVYEFVTVDNTPEGREELERTREKRFRANVEHNPYELLDRAREACEQILTSNSPGSHIPDPERRAAFICDVESASYVIKIIDDLLTPYQRDKVVSCDGYTATIEDGDFDDHLPGWLMVLGQLIERANIRSHERDAWAGKKQKQGGYKGALKSNPTPGEIKKRNIEIRKLWAKEASKYPNNAKGMIGVIDSDVATQLKIEARMVRRARLESNHK